MKQSSSRDKLGIDTVSYKKWYRISIYTRDELVKNRNR